MVLSTAWSSGVQQFNVAEAVPCESIALALIVGREA